MSPLYNRYYGEQNLGLKSVNMKRAGEVNKYQIFTYKI